jgi:hypothetical protein
MNGQMSLPDRHETLPNLSPGRLQVRSNGIPLKPEELAKKKFTIFGD